MVVIILILLSLGVAGFIMLSDTRKNNRFRDLDSTADAPVAVASTGDHTGHGAGDDSSDGGGADGSH